MSNRYVEEVFEERITPEDEQKYYTYLLRESVDNLASEMHKGDDVVDNLCINAEYNILSRGINREVNRHCDEVGDVHILRIANKFGRTYFFHKSLYKNLFLYSSYRWAGASLGGSVFDADYLEWNVATPDLITTHEARISFYNQILDYYRERYKKVKIIKNPYRTGEDRFWYPFWFMLEESFLGAWCNVNFNFDTLGVYIPGHHLHIELMKRDEEFEIRDIETWNVDLMSFKGLDLYDSVKLLEAYVYKWLFNYGYIDVILDTVAEAFDTKIKIDVDEYGTKTMTFGNGIKLVYNEKGLQTLTLVTWYSHTVVLDCTEDGWFIFYIDLIANNLAHFGGKYIPLKYEKYENNYFYFRPWDIRGKGKSLAPELWGARLGPYTHPDKRENGVSKVVTKFDDGFADAGLGVSKDELASIFSTFDKNVANAEKKVGVKEEKVHTGIPSFPSKNRENSNVPVFPIKSNTNSMKPNKTSNTARIKIDKDRIKSSVGLSPHEVDVEDFDDAPIVKAILDKVDADIKDIDIVTVVALLKDGKLYAYRIFTETTAYDILKSVAIPLGIKKYGVKRSAKLYEVDGELITRIELDNDDAYPDISKDTEFCKKLIAKALKK